MNIKEADEGADGITFAAFASGKCAAVLPSFDTYTSKEQAMPGISVVP